MEYSVNCCQGRREQNKMDVEVSDCGSQVLVPMLVLLFTSQCGSLEEHW